MIIGIIITIFALAILTGLLWMYIYNGLVARRNRVDQCLSGIDVCVKQRNDMLPNLVAAAMAYMGHEHDTLTRITALRERNGRETADEALRSGSEMSALLSRLSVDVENYPELKADTHFLRLQEEISDMERELQAVRRTYNAAVTAYNNAIEMFPSNIVAAAAHHTRRPLVEVPREELGTVSVAELIKQSTR